MFLIVVMGKRCVRHYHPVRPGHHLTHSYHIKPGHFVHGSHGHYVHRNFEKNMDGNSSSKSTWVPHFV